MVNTQEIIEKFNSGMIGVIPSDTLYGIHARAFDKKAVEKIYDIKGRTVSKPLIVLISDISDLEKFGIIVEENVKNFLVSVWPAKLTVVLPCKNSDFEYIHRGNNSIAFRMPDREDLRDLIKKVGPIVSTTANPKGQKPAETIDEAKNYFEIGSATNSKIDFYIDEGKIQSEPSTLILIKLPGLKPRVSSFLLRLIAFIPALKHGILSHKIKNGKIEVLRQGAIKIDPTLYNF